MRKVIIDTDVCSDDAAAILLALRQPDVEVLAVTAVNGGVLLGQAVQNALMTCQVAGARVPVYAGADRPLFRDPFVTTGIHGDDGMGGCGLIHPSGKPVEGVHASDAILDLIRRYPGEIDLIALAPATNIGLAVLKDRNTMEQLHSITYMGTAGLGPGNVTPVAEANVFTDAESFDLMLGLSVPVTVLGFDLCVGDSAFDTEEMRSLEESGVPAAVFAAKASSALLRYNTEVRGRGLADICDAVAMGCYLWPDIVLQKDECAARVCFGEDDYGQVIFYTPEFRQTMETLRIPFEHGKKRCSLIRSIHTKAFKAHFKEALLS